MAKKLYSITKASVRKVRTKSGAIRHVAVKSHFNKLNRPGKKK